MLMALATPRPAVTMLLQIDCGYMLPGRAPLPSPGGQAPGYDKRDRQPRGRKRDVLFTTGPGPGRHAPCADCRCGPKPARLRLTPRVTLTQRVEAEPGGPDDWSFLRRPAILGFVAVVSICVGASLPSSPFKLEMGGTWFFGEANWPSTTLLLPGVVAVYGGMVLFVRVWFGLYQTLRARPGVPIKRLAYMLALWIFPLLAVAPLFSRDVFSYAAQGEMISHHINPYHYGPGTLGSGPYVSGSTTLGEHGGPLRAAVLDAGRLVGLPEPPPRAGHRRAARLQSVAGIALIAYCVPKLARSFGQRRRARLRAGGAQPADPARPRGRRAQRRHHGRAAPRRHHRGTVPPPGVGRRAVRRGRVHQGARRHGHRLRGVGLGRAIGALAPPPPE